MGLTFSGGDFGLEPILWAKLSAMIAASGGRIRIGNGRRTNDEQRRLYAQKPGLAAPPGKSNHEFGLAADLEGDLALAHRLAPAYGLYFPMGHEPWHIEVVGVSRHNYKGGDGGHFHESYTQDPGSGQLPTEPDRHNLGVQLSTAFGLMAGNQDETLLGAAQDEGLLGEAVDPALSSPVGTTGDITGAPNTVANPDAYAGVAPEDSRDILTPEQEEQTRGIGTGAKS